MLPATGVRAVLVVSTVQTWSWKFCAVPLPEPSQSAMWSSCRGCCPGRGRRCRGCRPRRPAPPGKARASRLPPPRSKPVRHFSLTKSSLERIDVDGGLSLREIRSLPQLGDGRRDPATAGIRGYRARAFAAAAGARGQKARARVPARRFELRTIGLKDRCSNQAELRRLNTILPESGPCSVVACVVEGKLNPPRK